VIEAPGPIQVLDYAKAVSSEAEGRNAPGPRNLQPSDGRPELGLRATANGAERDRLHCHWPKVGVPEDDPGPTDGGSLAEIVSLPWADRGVSLEVRELQSSPRRLGPLKAPQCELRWGWFRADSPAASRLGPITKQMAHPLSSFRGKTMRWFNSHILSRALRTRALRLPGRARITSSSSEKRSLSSCRPFRRRPAQRTQAS
jgi:hypothetical protein